MSLVWVACSVPSRLGSSERFRNRGGQLSALMMDSFGDAIIYIGVTGSGQVRSLPTTCSQEDDVFAWKAYNLLFKSFWHTRNWAVKPKHCGVTEASQHMPSWGTVLQRALLLDVHAVCWYRAAGDGHPSVMLFRRMLFTSSGVVMKMTLQLLSVYLDGWTLSDSLSLEQF